MPGKNDARYARIKAPRDSGCCTLQHTTLNVGAPKNRIEDLVTDKAEGEEQRCRRDKPDTQREEKEVARRGRRHAEQ